MLKKIKLTYVSLSLIMLLTLVLVGCDSAKEQEPISPPGISESPMLESESIMETEEPVASASPEPSIETPKETHLGEFATIELEADEFDMGFIDLTEPSIKEMKVYNRGLAPLTITKVTTSCGCTSGKMKKDTLAPGEEGILEITVDPKLFKGFQTTKVISLMSNDPNTPKATIRVTSRIRGEVIFSQKEVDFGALKKDATAEEKIRMTQTQLEEVDILSTSVPDQYAEHVSVEIVDIPESEWKEATLAENDLVIRVAPGLPVGAHKINIQLDLNNERYKGFKIPVTLGIEGAYTFKPDAITLRNVIPGEVQEGVMELSFTDTIEVLSAKIDNENIQVSYKEGTATKTYTFDVWIPENHELVLQRGELTVKLKIKGTEVEHIIRVLALLKR